jgi:putative oxidoreductase
MPLVLPHPATRTIQGEARAHQLEGVVMNQAAADDVGKLILRLALGVMILLHGINKITSGVSGMEGGVTALGLPAYFVYGVYVGEVLAPLMLILGFYGRIGALLIFVNMVFAVVIAHRADLFLLTGQGGWKLELQGMYMFTALALAIMGQGRLSLQRR